MSRSTRTHLLLALLVVAGAPGLRAQTASPDLADDEVAHVALTANSIDVDLARLAQARTGNAAIRQFATTMITDHTAVNAQAAALAGRLGVTPRDNAVSQSLQAGAAQARTALDQLQGTAFDRGYIEREVAYHQAVLNALDGLLIPTTSNAELRQLLVAVRPAIAAHLEHAREIQRSLESGS